MAMLADKKSKQKWSEDPRNITWSNDKGRYGYQMLEKMGWADGKGLGRKQSGKTSHVKIKKRKQNLGLGAKETHDQDWMAQQEDFSNLLSALQQHGGNAELKTEEQNNKAMLEVAKASRKRVFYKKFIRSKDTSQYSKNDLACIFGKTASHSAPTTPQDQSDEETRSEDSSTSCPTTPQNTTASDTSFVTYTSKHNIQEYFAGRMKALRDGRGNARNKEDDDGHAKDCEDRTSPPCSAKKNKKLKKAKKKRKEAEDEANERIEVDAPKKKKKRKKIKTCEGNEGNASECLTNEEKCVMNGEDGSWEILDSCNAECDEEPKPKKIKKKKKPRNNSLRC